MNTQPTNGYLHDCVYDPARCRCLLLAEGKLMTPTSTLQLACPTCLDEIEIAYQAHHDCRTEVVSLRTWCFCPLSREDVYALLMNEGARQAELATERAGERP